MSKKNHFGKTILITVIMSWVLQSGGASVWASDAYETIAKIPVQHGGRIKPFHSFAEEIVRFVTEKRNLQGVSATETVWGWLTKPEVWNKEPLIPVTYRPLQQDFKVMLVNRRISPEVLLSHPSFLNRAEAALSKQRKNETLSFPEKKTAELYEKASVFRMIGEGYIPGWIAQPESPQRAWMNFQQLATPDGQRAFINIFSESQLIELNETLRNLFIQLNDQPDSQSAQQAAVDFKNLLNRMRETHGIILDEKNLNREILYHNLRPFHWAWMLYLASILLLMMSSKKIPTPPMVGTAASAASVITWVAGFLFHSYGFYLRCMIAGRPPVSNMYESVIWVSWAAIFFALILWGVYRAAFLQWSAAAVAVLALMIAESFPVLLNPSISPLEPVLRSNLWLTVHVLTITLSYGAFALAWGMGHWAMFGFALRPDKKEANLKIAQYIYRAIQIGVILLASGTVLGGVWANYSWGRFWGWDPKETWALIALLGYLMVLHGRFARWLNTFGLVVGAVVAFLGILMAWYGVNFVLAAGLHSYGFGGGGLPYVAAAVAADLFAVFTAVFLYKKNNRRMTAFSSR